MRGSRPLPQQQQKQKPKQMQLPNAWLLPEPYDKATLHETQLRKERETHVGVNCEEEA
jgi:hypothetical protein